MPLRDIFVLIAASAFFNVMRDSCSENDSDQGGPLVAGASRLLELAVISMLAIMLFAEARSVATDIAAGEAPCFGRLTAVLLVEAVAISTLLASK